MKTARFATLLSAVVCLCLFAGVGRAQSWVATGTGPFTWELGSNWSGGTAPNSNNAVATFSNTANAASFQVNVTTAIALQELIFNANQTGVVTIGGTGNITFATNGNDIGILLDANSADHVINLPVNIGGSNNAQSRIWEVDGTRTLTVNGNVGQTSARSISKAGTGTIIFTADNVFSGGFNVTGGSAYINNTTGSGTGTGPVTVSAGGKLGGTGTISGTVTVSGVAGNTGKLAPGTASAVGNLTVSNNVTFGTDTEFVVRLNGATNGSYDRLTSSGNVVLTGSSLTASVGGGYTPTFGDKLFIIVNSGAATTTTGTFNGLAEGATVNISGFDFAIHYGANFEAGGQPLTGGNDVALTPVPEPATVLGVAAVGALAVQLRRRRNRV